MSRANNGRTYTFAEYNALERKMKKGWFMYYQLLDEHVNVAHTILNEFPVSAESGLPEAGGNEAGGIPAHISSAFYDMCKALNRDYSCVVCLEVVEKEKFKMTHCGHMYCKDCHDKVKERFKECSICKKKI